MSHYKNQFEIESDLSSSIQFHHFRQEVRISENKMHELVHHQQEYNRTIVDLIHQGVSKIKIQQLKYGLAYLSEAEKLLEYGASCGKIIDREHIIATLHNQAVCYQKLNEQDRAKKYVQAIIFNLKAHIKTIESTPTTSRLTEHHKNKKSAEQNLQIYTHKLQLAEYYLVFCSLNSQLGCREESLAAGKKGIQIYKEYFRQLIQRNSKMQEVLCLGEDKQRLTSIFKGLQVYKNENELEKESIQKIIRVARSSIKKWNHANKIQKGAQTVLDKYMGSYSIGNLVELSALQIYQKQKQSANVFSQGKKIVQNLANFSMGYFQIATEYRLISQKYLSTKKTSLQHKNSLLYYLLSIIFIGMHIPYNFLFMKQIIQSFEYHFQIDLMSFQESTADCSFLFISASTTSKSRKKSVNSKNINSNGKTQEFKIRKNSKKKILKNKDHICSRSKVQEEYLVSSYVIGNQRKRVTSTDSHKISSSKQSKPMKLQRNTQSGQIEDKVKRIRSVTRMNKKQTKDELKSDHFQDYGAIDSQKIENDQTKKVAHRVSRTISTDAYTQLRGFEKEQYPSLYRPLKKTKEQIKKVSGQKKNKKNTNNKDSASSPSRASFDSKKKKKKVLTKKQKAKQQTLANYYL